MFHNLKHPPSKYHQQMTNFYLLAYKYNINETMPGILTFTRKDLAIEFARYYRDELQYDFVSLRHFKQSHCGICDIIGFIDF